MQLSPMRVVAALSTLLVTGCEPEPPCDAELLRVGLEQARGSEDPVKAGAQQLLLSCDADRFEPSLWSWLGSVAAGESVDETAAGPLWARVCDVPFAAAAAAGPHQKQEIYASCSLETHGLGTGESFAWAEGEPLLAYALLGSVKADEKLEVPEDLLLQAAAVLRGEPLFDGVASFGLPVTEQGATPVRGPLRALDAADLGGDPLITAPATTPLRDILYATGPDIDQLRFLGLTEAGHWTELSLRLIRDRAGISVYANAAGFEVLVDGKPIPPAEDCPATGPTVCSAAGTDLKEVLTSARSEHPDLPVIVHPNQGATLADLLALRPVLGTFAVFDPEGYAPCVDPAPEGTVCVPGGPVLVGQHGATENPLREVVVSTFYLDARPITRGEYSACEQAGACPEPAAKGSADEPVHGLPWMGAVHYCGWAGKRLPTLWEWEKAARGPNGEMYSWGNEPPSCETSWNKGCGTAARPVGKAPAARFGLQDLEGNGAEWTSTWTFRSLERCGADCEGVDPLGPCQGSHPCTGYSARAIKGAGWQEASAAATSWTSRFHKQGAAGVGMRCATDKPYLTRFPPKIVAKPHDPPAKLVAPSEEQLKIFHAVPDDPIEEKPICEEARRSTLECRDPQHYLTPNEEREHVFRRYIRNLGGCYVGVASDQNYSFASAAKSEWVYLMDYDPMVVRVHKMNIALIGAAEDPKAFVALFDEKNAAETVKVIEAYWKDDPEVALTSRFFLNMRRRFSQHYGVDSLKTGTEDDKYGWLRVPEHYQHMRTLQQQNRLRAVKGDMLYDDGALRAIGRACEALGSPMRLYYTSNAPDVWGGQLTDEYKANVLAMPMDDKSVVVQAFGFPTGFGQTGYWHFNVQSGVQHQERLRLPGYNRVWELVTERIPTDDPDLTVQGLPSD